MGARRSSVWVAACALVLVGLSATSCAKRPDGERSQTKPQMYMDFGLLKMSVLYKESQSIEKLKLGKSTMHYFLSFTESDPYRWDLGKCHQRQEMVRCGNFLLDMPEVESLLDCKPLDTKQDGPAVKYVKRTTFSWVMGADIGLGSAGDKQEYQFYQLEADHTDQSIKAILVANGMPQGIGFGPYSTTSGHFFVANLPPGIRCTGNLFTSVNLTEPIPARSPFDSYPRFYHVLNHLVEKIYMDGGLVAIKDMSCSSTADDHYSTIEQDFTLIKRSQFPYITCKHRITTSPIEFYWNYTGAILQSKDDLNHEAYTTNIKIQSESSLLAELNFELKQNFTNLDFDTGSEHMALIHPIISSVVTSNWTVNSFSKSLYLFFDSLAPTLLHKIQAGVDMYKVSVHYRNEPKDKAVALTLMLDRDVFNRFKRWFAAEESMYETDPPEQDPDLDSGVESGRVEL